MNWVVARSNLQEMIMALAATETEMCNLRKALREARAFIVSITKDEGPYYSIIKKIDDALEGK